MADATAKTTETMGADTKAVAIEALRRMRGDALDGLAALGCDEVGTGREFDLLEDFHYATRGLKDLGATA